VPPDPLQKGQPVTDFKLHENEDLPYHLRELPLSKTFRWVRAWADVNAKLHEEIERHVWNAMPETDPVLIALRVQVEPALMSMVAPLGGACAPDALLEHMTNALEAAERLTFKHELDSDTFDADGTQAAMFGLSRDEFKAIMLASLDNEPLDPPSYQTAVTE
jgi:hypothetical protein